MIAIPDEFARRRIHVSGDEGKAWIAALPGHVEHMCQQWQLTVDGAPLSGEVGLAIPVIRDNQQLMLKSSYPDPDSAYEAFALEVWNGHGAVQLVDHEGQWILLLERLNSSQSLRSLEVDKALIVAAQLLRHLAVESPNGPPSQAETVHNIRQEFVAERLHGTCGIPTNIVDLALECAQSSTPQQSLLVNTDLHYENVLAGTREPWLAIDPKVVIGDVEYGIAPLIWNLREHFVHTSPRVFLDAIVAAGNFDHEQARRLTILRTVDYWIWAVETGLTNDPVMCHQIVESLQ